MRAKEKRLTGKRVSACINARDQELVRTYLCCPEHPTGLLDVDGDTEESKLHLETLVEH